MQNLFKQIWITVLVLCVSLTNGLSQQVNAELRTPMIYGNSVKAEHLKKHLTIIASDEFEGRETGTPGNEKAADYIANHFKELGLPPVGDNGTYFQDVSFRWSSWKDVSLTINGKNFKHKSDFICFPTQNSHQPEIKVDEVLFLGYGIDSDAYSDYKGVDVKDKVLLIYDNEPFKKKGTSMVTKTKDASIWSTDKTQKIRTAFQKGAKAVLIINHQMMKEVTKSLKFIIGNQLTLGDKDIPSETFANSAYISTNIAKEILGKRRRKITRRLKRIRRRGKSRALRLPVDLTLKQEKNVKTLIGKNVLGYIEGSDPQLKEELVIVSAHYDHLGKKGEAIYNGADDNGSGSSTALDVAEAFALAKKDGAGPKRSVLILMMTGEEKGLLGSKYYVENPIFPLKNTVADVNVDMVGRVDKKYADNPDYVYVIGADRLSSDLHNINEAMNKKYTNLTLDYTYNEEDDPNRYYYRSDHYNFAKNGIPAIFYFNGTHKDYHRPSDTVEKINFEKMEKIGRLVFYTTWELANRPERIKVDKPIK